LFKTVGMVGVEDFLQCPVAAFVLSLGFLVSGHAGDSSTPVVGEEELSGHDPALTIAAKFVAVIGLHLLGHSVGGQRHRRWY
jgi:hypothetical protein